MWVVFVLSVITIPIFFYYDDRQISEADLSVIDNLTLAKNPDYNGGKRPRINISLSNTDRTLVVNLEELNCVNKDEILSRLKTGDKITVKVFTSDTATFYNAGLISKYQKIYGLKSNGKEFIELSCRNLVSTTKTTAAIYASCATAFVSFILAMFFFRVNPIRRIKIDPILLVCVIWLLVMIAFR